MVVNDTRFLHVPTTTVAAKTLCPNRQTRTATANLKNRARGRHTYALIGILLKSFDGSTWAGVRGAAELRRNVSTDGVRSQRHDQAKAYIFLAIWSQRESRN